MKHVLIVDDDQDFAEVLKVRFETSGDFTVSTAENGEEALRFIQRSVPDLILMDVLMPCMDGLTALKAMNQTMEKRVPVIVLTGQVVMAKNAFKSEGACDFLTKPVDGAFLLSRAKEILAQPVQR